VLARHLANWKLVVLRGHSLAMEFGPTNRFDASVDVGAAAVDRHSPDALAH
jgi:hypothetical protein